MEARLGNPGVVDTELSRLRTIVQRWEEWASALPGIVGVGVIEAFALHGESVQQVTLADRGVMVMRETAYAIDCEVAANRLPPKKEQN